MFACLTLVSLLDRVPLIFILCSLLQGKIPVISDPTENTDTFFAFQNSNIIEMKSVIVAKSSQGLESALEKMRQKLVAALKSGSSHDQRRSVTCGKGTRLSSDCPTLLPTLKSSPPSPPHLVADGS
mmetsp:Transcript_43295/g.136843  ORF Transcript_43295/g.136843 Transcript_43295/m.136843 type:complete len:126 (+) Transcript_43295:1144-1521(+)